MYVECWNQFGRDHFLGALQPPSWFPAWICSGCQAEKGLMLKTEELVIGQRPSRGPAWTVAPQVLSRHWWPLTTTRDISGPMSSKPPSTAASGTP